MGFDPRITALNSFPLRRTIIPPIGSWLGPADAAVIASSVLTAGTATMSPVLIPTQITCDTIGCTITTGGSAGALVRLGLVSPDANGLPSTLLLDAGTVDATVTGQRTITINQTLPAGLYWFVLVAQGGAATQPTIRTTNHAFGIPGTQQAQVVGNTLIPQITGVTAAFPAAAAAFAPTGYAQGSSAPVVNLHRSA